MMIHETNSIYDSILTAKNVEDEFFLAIENRDTALMISEQQKAKLKNRVAEQEAVIHSMVQGLLNSGMSLEQIAQITNKSVDYIQKILGKQQ